MWDFKLRGYFMSEVMETIGKNIKSMRKKRGMTLEALAKALYKSKATISKYENGQITIDVETIYEIAQVLEVGINQLLYYPEMASNLIDPEFIPTFFRNTSRLYSYLYDGRNNKVATNVLDILYQESPNCFHVMYYMNIKSLEEYQICENTYEGSMRHYDALSTITVQHVQTKMESYTVHILASFLDTPTKWAFCTGVSFRPFMPIATKVLFTKRPVVVDKNFTDSLIISKEDLRLLKLYNMFSVVG